MVAVTDHLAAAELEPARSDWVRPWGTGGQPRDQLAIGHDGEVLWDVGAAMIESSPGMLGGRQA